MGKKRRRVQVRDLTCIVCLGHGKFQWVEGLGEPIDCPGCDGRGFNPPDDDPDGELLAKLESGREEVG
jgi:hypothetical protein